VYTFDEKVLQSFAESTCQRSTILYEHAMAGGCELAEREQLIDDVNESCCVQEGVNVCDGSAAEVRCNAECSLSFIPFWERCMVHFESGADNDAAMALFTQLYASCSLMPPNEVGKLMKTAGDYVDNPDCAIDTSMIMSSDAAAAPCMEDASPLCQVTLDSHMATCETNYCPTCDQPHVCDTTCAVPCVDSDAGKAGKPPPPPPAAACETNMAAMCDPSIAAGMATCEDDYCVTCAEAHACDKSCRLPCARGGGGGGKRRAQADGAGRTAAQRLFPTDTYNTMACPLDLFIARVEEVAVACCDLEGDAPCPPENCSYDCGRVFTRYMTECSTTLYALGPPALGACTPLAPFSALVHVQDPQAKPVCYGERRRALKRPSPSP
jgi:hypothetical protein